MSLISTFRQARVFLDTKGDKVTKCTSFPTVMLRKAYCREVLQEPVTRFQVGSEQAVT